MSLAAFIIGITALFGQMGTLYLLWSERKKLHKRLNVQRKTIQIVRDTMSAGHATLYEAIGKVSADCAEAWDALTGNVGDHQARLQKLDENLYEVAVRVSSLENSKASNERKLLPPRTLTQAKREAEQRLAQLSGVPQ